MSKINLYDVTLRDGNHALQHQISKEQIRCYLEAIDDSGIYCAEVGHGNGLGASCFQIGKSKVFDKEMLKTARKSLKKTKLGVHVIPGFATIEKDIKPALDLGVDIFRVAAHCTEIDTTQKHIEFLRARNVEVYGVLMMSHRLTSSGLVEASQKIAFYGGAGIIIMDSAGAYFPEQVFERVSLIKNAVRLPVGFHAHNNLGLAIANSMVAAKAGACILDASSRGLGAGAGNCSLEILSPILKKLNYITGTNPYAVFDVADLAEKILVKDLPFSKTMSIVTALAGIFSGFSKPILKYAEQYNVDPKDIVFELGNRQVVAGQEDMIVEVAESLSKGLNA